MIPSLMKVRHIWFISLTFIKSFFSLYKGDIICHLFYLCARQGASIWRCKSSTGPTGGTVSRTARVSIVRWNLKEAAGKALARRTEIAYEASRPGEEANIFKARYLHGRPGRRCGGHKREGGCALPGEVCRSAQCYRRREASGRVGRSQPRA